MERGAHARSSDAVMGVAPSPRAPSPPPQTHMGRRHRRAEIDCERCRQLSNNRAVAAIAAIRIHTHDGAPTQGNRRKRAQREVHRQKGPSRAERETALTPDPGWRLMAGPPPIAALGCALLPRPTDPPPFTGAHLPRASARSISLYCCCKRVRRFSGTGYLFPYEA